MSLIELLDIDLLIRMGSIIGVIIAGLSLWLSWKWHREKMKKELQQQKKLEKAQNKMLNIQRQQLDLLRKQTPPSSPEMKQKSEDLGKREKKTTGRTIIDIIKTIGWLSSIKEEIDKNKEKDNKE